MLVGHVAAGMLAKRAERKLSLGTAVLAALLADLLVGLFLIAGIERCATVPGATLNRTIGLQIAYTHSLATTLAI